MSAQQQPPQDYSEAWRQYYAAQVSYAAQQQQQGGGGGQVRAREGEKREIRVNPFSFSFPSHPPFFRRPTPFLPLSHFLSRRPIPRRQQQRPRGQQNRTPRHGQPTTPRSSSKCKCRCSSNTFTSSSSGSSLSLLRLPRPRPLTTPSLPRRRCCSRLLPLASTEGEEEGQGRAATLSSSSSSSRRTFRPRRRLCRLKLLSLAPRRSRRGEQPSPRRSGQEKQQE